MPPEGGLAVFAPTVPEDAELLYFMSDNVQPCSNGVRKVIAKQNIRIVQLIKLSNYGSGLIVAEAPDLVIVYFHPAPLTFETERTMLIGPIMFT